MNQANPAKPRLAPEEAINRLQRQIEKFNNLLSVEASEEDLKAFDVDTGSVLADAFGNPSKIIEVYAYAQLGEAGGLINLQEEAQLDGAQDMAHQSLQQRKGVLAQALAELEEGLAKKGN